MEFLIYGLTAFFVIATLFVYISRGKKANDLVQAKVEEAQKTGAFVPNSLHPYVNLNSCMGSGACIKACPEKDILGIMNGKATLINATSCIGHGACFLACPVDAITLRIGSSERGVDLPHVLPTYESNVPGLYIAGELGGMGLIKNASEQGIQAMKSIAASLQSVTSNLESEVDVIIIGAGPAGISAALQAKELGLSVKLLDRQSLGGTVFTFPRQKVVMTRPMYLPGYGAVKLVNTSKGELLSIWEEALSKNGLSVEEKVEISKIEQIEGGFKLTDVEGIERKSKRVLLAIGRRGSPRKLGIPGEDSAKVTYQLIEPEQFENLKIIVVGGGDSAIESALLLAEQNKVILSYRKSNFTRIKAGNKLKIESAISQGQLEVRYNSQLVEIRESSVFLQEPNGIQEIPNDQVFIFAGGELPNAFLKAAGIQVERHFGKTVKSHRS